MPILPAIPLCPSMTVGCLCESQSSQFPGNIPIRRLAVCRFTNRPPCGFLKRSPASFQPYGLRYQFCTTRPRVPRRCRRWHQSRIFASTRLVSFGMEQPQIGLDALIVILHSDEIRLQYFDSRLREPHAGCPRPRAHRTRLCQLASGVANPATSLTRSA